jgi:DNA-binding transcriptional ArsR family regulator
MNLVFAALADQRRRAILEYLKGASRSAGEIAARFDVSWPAISRHLRILREAGLVTVFPVGRSRQYTLNSAPVTAAIESLAGLSGSPSAVTRPAASMKIPSFPVGREAVS